jgi:ATP-dependent exoDNAse (exonuclease V) alpha subunit
MLLLGTAGTGKTHTAKAAVMGARRILGKLDSVKMIAHTGVAAANLGGGATTIDSLFQTQESEDLESEALDRLVEKLRDTELLVIDEISMVGAGQFEMISRRLEQVAKVLWQEQKKGRQPQAAVPESFGGFGGIGVLLMGDFAQLPPIKATSLLRGSRLEEGLRSGLRHRAIQGRLQFEQFMKQVIQLRRIHRQKGADEYKESTMRLRDAAITAEDHALWQQHDIPSTESEPTWEGGEDLHKTGVVLVAQNAIAGRVNGQRLRKRTRALEEPAPDRATGIVVRCDAVHGDFRAEKASC